MQVSVSEMLQTWMKAHEVRPSAKQQNDFRQFLDWAAFYGLPMPVGGEEIAAYLLELTVDGASLNDIKRTARAIVNGYAKRRQFLDLAPIRAAIKIAQAQLDPRRTIN